MNRPIIVCLCGSTRFKEEFIRANLRETLKGKIVLSVGYFHREDLGAVSEDELALIKTQLDSLQLSKIDLADEVLILNVGGYIGESTSRELDYCRSLGKVIRFLEGDGK